MKAKELFKKAELESEQGDTLQLGDSLKVAKYYNAIGDYKQAYETREQEIKDVIKKWCDEPSNAITDCYNCANSLKQKLFGDTK